jgi:hypothetical protein
MTSATRASAPPAREQRDVVSLPLAREALPVVQQAVRRSAHATAATAPQSEILAQVDQDLEALRTGALTINDQGESDRPQPRLPDVSSFFTAGNSATEHLTDPRTGHDSSFCDRPTTATHEQPSGPLCARCCAEFVLYCLVPDQ